MSLPPTERPYTYVLCEPFAAGISAVEGAEGSTIGVVGLGPVGLGSALWGLAKKQRVIAIGRHGWQLSVARSVGMDAYHELEALPSSVAEHVIVAAATQSALSIACDLVAARGTIHLVGMNVDSEDWRAGAGGGYEFFRRSLTVRHCYMYSLGHVREALVLICSYEKLLQEAIIGPINLSDLDGKFPIGLAGRRMIVSPPHS
jgi:threonine dehydrogenase-like Zn-dependent dehydrogenase